MLCLFARLKYKVDNIGIMWCKASLLSCKHALTKKGSEAAHVALCVCSLHTMLFSMCIHVGERCKRSDCADASSSLCGPKRYGCRRATLSFPWDRPDVAKLLVWQTAQEQGIQPVLQGEYAVVIHGDLPSLCGILLPDQLL